MENELVRLLLQYVDSGFGGIIVLLLIVGVPWYKRDIKAREEANRLEKIRIKVMSSTLNFFKKEGYDVQIPDITNGL